MLKSLTFVPEARWAADARFAASRQFLPVTRQSFTGH
jgi:hypothetical protein